MSGTVRDATRDATAKVIGTVVTTVQKAVQKRQIYLTVMSSIKDIDEVMSLLQEQGYITFSTTYMGENSIWEKRVMISTRHAFFS